MPETPPNGALPFSSDQSKPKRRFFPFLVSFLTVGGIALTSFFLWQRFFKTPPEVGPTQAAPVSVAPSFPPKESEKPVAEEVRLPADAIYQSEHFRVGDIALGGEAALTIPEIDVTPLEILSVRGEAFTEKNKKGSQLVITWETSKPALSEVSYGKNIESAEGVIREEAYGTNHSLIIPELAPASTYIYTIASRDKWGNTAKSDPYAVYTGAREVSLFELIAGAVGDVFGWAVDK